MRLLRLCAMTKFTQRLRSAHTMVTEHLSICSSYAILLRHIFRLISSLVDPHRINRSHSSVHSLNYRNIFKSSNHRILCIQHHLTLWRSPIPPKLAHTLCVLSGVALLTCLRTRLAMSILPCAADSLVVRITSLHFVFLAPHIRLRFSFPSLPFAFYLQQLHARYSSLLGYGLTFLD